MQILLQGDRLIEKLTKTKHLRLATFVLAFLEATISPILPEAFLLVVLAYRKDISWKVLSLISALGSATGALAMYFLGMKLYANYGERIINFLHGGAFVERAEELFSDNVFMAQFLASLTPLPDRVFSFLAGAFVVSPFLVFIATFLGRLIRVSVVAYLSYEYGDEARDYLKKHTKITVACITVLVLLYIAYKTLL